MKSYTTGAIVTASASVSEWYSPTNTQSGTFAAITNDTTVAGVMPGSFTLTGIYVAGAAAVGASPKAFDFIPYQNGSATSFDVQLQGAAATTANDTNPAHATNYVQGDTFSFASVPTSTPTNVTVGYALEWSGTGEPIFAQSVSLSTSATQYFAPGVGGTASTNISTTEAAISVAWPHAGTFTNLTSRLKTTTGAAPKNRTFTIFKNGLATSSVVSITGGASGNDNSDTVSVARGDLISIQSTVASTPAASITVHGFIFTPTTDGSSVYLLGSSVNAAASNTTFNMVYAGMRSGWNTTEANSLGVNPVSVTATVYTVAVQTAASPGAWVGTIRQNAADTGLTTTVTGPALSSVASGLSVSLTAATTNFTVKSTSTGSPAGSTGGWRHAIGIYIAPPVGGNTGGLMSLL